MAGLPQTNATSLSVHAMNQSEVMVMVVLCGKNNWNSHWNSESVTASLPQIKLNAATGSWSFCVANHLKQQPKVYTKQSAKNVNTKQSAKNVNTQQKV